MKSSNAPRLLAALIGSMLVVLCSAACSVGSLGTGDQADGETTITYLVFNEPSTVKAANALIAAFEKDNPRIKVKLDTMPTGSDGDNVMKTRLSTGEMSDVFSYNSGSLLQAIRPDEYLVSLSDQSGSRTSTSPTCPRSARRRDCTGLRPAGPHLAAWFTTRRSTPSSG